jgi:thioredoxin reductase/ferredoxin
MAGLEEILIYGATAVFVVGVVWFYLKKGQTASATTAAKVHEAKATGRFEPVSLYPHIDPTVCIGSGACVRACPEKDILGIVDGKATVINTSSCVGHGACFMACPVDAITLRIGSAQRGVDLPHVKPTYESNVEGMYIAGELGGMGLIKNSAEQGVQAIDNLVKRRRPAAEGAFDVAIVGAGPAGIAAALAAKQAGLNFTILEQDSLGGTVFTFPRAKLVMTSPMDLPLYGKVKLTNTSKGELLALWEDVLSRNNITIREHTKVDGIGRSFDGMFDLQLSTGEPCRAAHVVLAIGRRGTPRKLGVPGEDGNEKVAYRLLDPELIEGENILVVGGGDSAVESALLLADANNVHLSYRKTTFNRIKPGNQSALQSALETGKLTPHFGTNVQSIGATDVVIQGDGEPYNLPADRIYIFAGGELPTTFLQKAGIEVEKAFGKVVRKHGLVWLGLLLSLATASGQFSPGDLSHAHAELEGLGNCTECHEVGAKISETRCLDCHAVLQERVDAGRGFHSSSEVVVKRCEDCHSEHHGRNFELIRFDTTAFDHKKLAGWPIEGAHAAIDCRACHKPDFITDDRLSPRPGTFLGLQTECLACHDDEHEGTLPSTCLDCHGMETFEGAEDFNHDKADFALTGAHKKIDCAACHREEPRYPALAHAQCTDCHEDAHEDSFGPRCTDCHNTSSWVQLNVGNTFDHNKTGFPLQGMHEPLACNDCHKTRPAKSMPFGRCLDCHDDYHEGDFIEATGQPQDCDGCHDVMKPFAWARFGLQEHNESEYPLTDAHLATPCFACHKPSPDDRWDFSFPDQTCTACHDNVHAESLADWAMTGCADCHNTAAWADISFDHDQTEWALNGAHEQADCRACHGAVSEGQTFSDLPARCADCHDDVHAGQFDPAPGTPADCASCHTPSGAWQADRFDHSTTAFPLDGQHATVDCAACHKPDPAQPDITFCAIPSFQCIDCHAQ